jgi:Mn-dependent DtxR family transcriptional regulator
MKTIRAHAGGYPGTERDRYVVLLHVRTLLETGTGGVPIERIERELGFAPAALESLVQSSIADGFVRFSNMGGLTLTRTGLKHLEEVEAAERWSIRGADGGRAMR